MFLKEMLLLLTGLAAGSTVAAGVYAFLAVIGVYPRLMGKTATASKRKIFLYETLIVLGGLFGNVVDLFTEKGKQLTEHFWETMWLAGVPESGLWQPILMIAGMSCGIFVGCLVMSLAETLKALPVLSRRLHLSVGLPYVILAIAAGKCAGSLYYFLYRIGD